MRIVSATFILTAIAGIHAGIINPEGTNDIGTFNTFTAPQCSGGGSPIAVEDGTASGELPEGVLSIRSHLSSCALVIVEHRFGERPVVIQPGDTRCARLFGRGALWRVVCP